MTPPTTDPDILTFDDLRAYLRVPKASLYRYVEGGIVPAFKLGGRWRARKSDLEAWMTKQVKTREVKARATGLRA